MTRWTRWTRWTLLTAGALAALLIAGVAIGYAATAGDHAVPRTVMDDPSLPNVTIDGVRLHVVTFGDPARPPVIVVHGGPGRDSRYLLPLRALADEFHVVLYDQRGTGLSERVPDDRLRLEDHYRELDGIVDRFGGGRPVRLVGHSWGAMLASGYVGRHPEKVLQVVLAEPGMLTSETARRLMAATNDMRPPLSASALLAVARAWLGSLHVRGPDADARRDHLVAAIVDAPLADHPTAGYYCGRDLRTARAETWRQGARPAMVLFAEGRRADGAFDVDFVRGVERFPRKVLFLAGSCDAVIGADVQRLHMRSFPSAELVVIEGAGHTMFGERPLESIAAVRRYFREAAD